MDTSTPRPIDPQHLLSPAPKQTIRRNASWGAITSIVIILAMVIIGAFYAWGERIAEYRAAQAAAQSGQ